MLSFLSRVDFKRRQVPPGVWCLRRSRFEGKDVLMQSRMFAACRQRTQHTCAKVNRRLSSEERNLNKCLGLNWNWSGCLGFLWDG